MTRAPTSSASGRCGSPRRRAAGHRRPRLPRAAAQRDERDQVSLELVSRGRRADRRRDGDRRLRLRARRGRATAGRRNHADRRRRSDQGRGGGSSREREMDGIRRAQRAAEAGHGRGRSRFCGGLGASMARCMSTGSRYSPSASAPRCAKRAGSTAPRSPPEVIVASVWQGFGHEAGSGPLPAGLPIEVDLWPGIAEAGAGPT